MAVRALNGLAVFLPRQSRRVASKAEDQARCYLVSASEARSRVRNSAGAAVARPWKLEQFEKIGVARIAVVERLRLIFHIAAHNDDDPVH